MTTFITEHPYFYDAVETPNYGELFLEEVRKRLIKNKLSARKASTSAGLGEKYVTKILRGEHRPSRYGAIKLMTLLAFPKKTQRSFLRNYVPTLAAR